MQESWDKKKIVFAVFFFCLFAVAAYAAKKYVLDGGNQFAQKPPVSSTGLVEGASTASTENQDTPTPPFSVSASSIQNTLQEKIASLRGQVTNLSVDEIASASPQVQKVITDLKALQDFPKNQAKQFCENLCRNF